MIWAEVKDFMSLVSSAQHALLLAEPSGCSDEGPVSQFWVFFFLNILPPQPTDNRERLATTEGRKSQNNSEHKANSDEERDRYAVCSR